MSSRHGTRMFAPLSLAALGLLALSGGARAQNVPSDPAAPASDPTMKKVTLDLESTNLYSALKMLFGHVNANYYLDPSLKNAEVSVHLHDIPFKTVLDTLVKSTGLPLTWKFDDNIYRIVPKEVETTVGPEEGRPSFPEASEPKSPKIVILSRDSFAFDAMSLVEALGGKQMSLLPRIFDVNPYPVASGGQSGNGSGQNGGLGGGGLGTGGQGGGFGGSAGSSSGGFGGGGRNRGF
jgi:hypothetical protein